MKFVDSSALVALLASEPDGETYAELIDDADGCITSPVVVFETVLALVRIYEISISEAEALVLEQLQRSRIEIVRFHRRRIASHCARTRVTEKVPAIRLS